MPERRGKVAPLGERLPIGGVLLCGGKSSRMGQSKAWLDFGGKTMLAHVAAILANVVDPIIIVAAPGQKIPPIESRVALRIVRDEVAYQGPLAGIAHGLEALADNVDAAYVTSVDVPLLRPAWIRLLFESLGRADVAVPVVDGRPHPLAGVYRCRVAPTARSLLAQGRHRPIFLYEEHPTVRVGAEQLRRIDPELDSLCNANTPDEHAALLSRWQDTP